MTKLEEISLTGFCVTLGLVVALRPLRRRFFGVEVVARRNLASLLPGGAGRRLPVVLAEVALPELIVILGFLCTFSFFISDCSALKANCAQREKPGARPMSVLPANQPYSRLSYPSGTR